MISHFCQEHKANSSLGLRVGLRESQPPSPEPLPSGFTGTAVLTGHVGPPLKWLPSRVQPHSFVNGLHHAVLNWVLGAALHPLETLLVLEPTLPVTGPPPDPPVPPQLHDHGWSQPRTSDDSQTLPGQSKLLGLAVKALRGLVPASSIT